MQFKLFLVIKSGEVNIEIYINIYESRYNYIIYSLVYHREKLSVENRLVLKIMAFKRRSNTKNYAVIFKKYLITWENVHKIFVLKSYKTS